MLKVLLLFVLLIAGIVVGPMIAGHQGYVLIQTCLLFTSFKRVAYHEISLSDLSRQ